MTNRTLIDRPKFFQLVDLFKSLKLCHDLATLSKTNRQYVGPLAVQLRALLFDRDKRSKALLLRLIDDFRAPPPLFFSPLPDFLSSSHTKVALCQRVITANRTDYDQVEVSIHDAIKQKIGILEGEAITVGDLIEWRANKYGGAHYPTKTEQKHALLEASYAPLADGVILDFGLTLAQYSRSLINQISEFTIYMAIKIDKLPNEEMVWLARCHRKTDACHFGICLSSSGRLRFRIFHSGNLDLSLEADQVIEKTNVNVISGHFAVSADFKTVVEISNNGNVIARNHWDLMPTFPFQGEHFGTSINKAVDAAGGQNFGFKLGHFLSINRTLNKVEAANLYHYMQSPADDNFLEFRPFSYGENSSLSEDFRLYGEVFHPSFEGPVSGIRNKVHHPE